MIDEDRLDRVASDVVAKMPQPTADARIAPSRVLVRYADHERGDLRLGVWATGPSRLRSVVFLGDECPVPPQDGVGSDDAGDGCEATATENLAFHSQTATLVVGETESSSTVHRAEDAVFIEQIVNDRLLLSIDPAGEQVQKEGERGRERVHVGSLPEERPAVQRIRDWLRRR